MLTREQLTADQWEAVRDTPHHVIVAVSVAGGSPFDEMLERAAGLRGIVEARGSAHPLLSEIAGAQHIMHAQDGIRRWFYTLAEPERTPRRLQDKALESARQALDALGTHGTAEDLQQYGQFVLALADRVARAAREGDVLGIGGELVSEQERLFIDRLDRLVQERRGR